MFTFFLQSYRKGILDFCGSIVEVKSDNDSRDGKFCFRLYDNGELKLDNLKSKHSNILKAVIIGKKSWGLWLNEWVDGISEGSFTSKEILKQFEDLNITIPDALLDDFYNRLIKKMKQRLL